MQVVLEEDVAICIVSEPPVIRSATSQWIISEDGLAPIYHRPEMSGHLMTPGVKLEGICSANVGGFLLIACYLSPRTERATVLEFLDDLTDIITPECRPILIAGDLNSKSPLWGSSVYNWKGLLVEEWISEQDLSVINSGSEPTCIRPQGTSIVDITLTSAAMTHSVVDWCVRTEVEFLSDHRYVAYKIHTNNPDVNSPNANSLPVNTVNSVQNTYVNSVHNTPADEAASNNTPTQVRGWSWTNMDEDKFRATLIWHAQNLHEALANNDYGVDTIAHRVQQTFTEAADVAAKRKSARKPRKSTYWWNGTIAELRSDTHQKRRRWMRYRGRRHSGSFNGERMIELENAYKSSKMGLRASIIKAKAKAWDDLLLLIDGDPWGLPFKIVTGKLRKSSPSLTELLSKSEREKVLSKLFPPGESHDPNTLWPDFTWEDRFEVTYAEVDRVLR